MKDTEQRFTRFVKKSRSCWEWNGSIDRYGYGTFKFQYKMHKAHRIAYMLWCDGDLDGTLVVHHTCSNRKCVRPEHLQAVTRADNSAEMLDRRKKDKRIKELEDEVDRLRKELRLVGRKKK